MGQGGLLQPNHDAAELRRGDREGGHGPGKVHVDGVCLGQKSQGAEGPAGGGGRVLRHRRQKLPGEGGTEGTGHGAGRGQALRVKERWHNNDKEVAKQNTEGSPPHAGVCGHRDRAGQARRPPLRGTQALH